MRIIALQSGSNGNCVYLEGGGVRLLFDAGISARTAAERLAPFGIELHGLDGLLVSHDHSDHARSIGVFQRKFGVPLHVTARTLAAADRRLKLGPLAEVHPFRAGDTLRFGTLRVETIPTPHDGADGVCFVVDDGRHRLGILTDLGHVFADLEGLFASLDAVLLESNYDPQMLADGGYPYWLKQRIVGPGGHLSNAEAAELVGRAASARLRWVCLGHLSQDNNCPRVAVRTHRHVLGLGLPLHVAGRHAASELLEV